MPLNTVDKSLESGHPSASLLTSLVPCMNQGRISLCPSKGREELGEGMLYRMKCVYPDRVDMDKADGENECVQNMYGSWSPAGTPGVWACLLLGKYCLCLVQCERLGCWG